ncbi:MAG: hypothetical protein ABSF61_09345 [Anaerolineales bacterium]|jgi:hypothetical protein
MPDVPSQSPPLDAKRFSVLAAAIVLANGLSRLVRLPSQDFVVTVLNIHWMVGVNGPMLFMVLLGALVASGAYSIYRSHSPALRAPSEKEGLGLHLIVPALTAVGGGAALSLVPSGPRWWVGLAFLSALVVLAVAGEYLALDRDDPYYAQASIGLEILVYSLLVLVFSALHAADTRLAMAMPLIALSTSILTLRVLALAAPLDRRIWAYTAGIGLLVGELALPLNFWPLPSVAYGLGLTVSAYVLGGLGRLRLQSELRRASLVEYAVVAALALLALLALTKR